MNQIIRFLTAFFLRVLLLLLILASYSVDAQRKSTSVRIDDNGKTTISIKNGFGNNFSVEYRGDITLTENDTDISAISRGGYLEIKKSAFGNRRRIFIEPDNSGGLIKKYYVGGAQKHFDGEGKKWLEEILLEVVRNTTLGAEKRVERMYRKGGSYQVLREVGYIRSNHVKARYIKLLLDKNPKSSDLAAVLNVVGEEIDSDHHRADILKHNASLFLASESATAAYIKATGKIDSDHHKAEVLKTAVRNGSVSETQLKSLFVIVKDIDSDHHKASVLLEVMKNKPLSPNNVKLLVNTAKDINSDHHKATVLKKALSSNQLSGDANHTLLKSIENMDSDHHMASVFSVFVRNELDAAVLSHMLRLIGDEMTSDNHKATVLKLVVEKQGIENHGLNDFIYALHEINSDHHQAEVFKKLARKKYSDVQLVALLKATESINSDYHKAESLISFSSTVGQKGTAVKDAYRDACDDINSESHFGRAIRAIQ
ncbi:MAG: hypothetical protein AAGB24_14960 [Bacteroidota bacterium]